MNWSIINTEAEFQKAIDRMELIFHKTKDPKISDEFDLLSFLISKYEEDNFAIDEADPIQIIKMKMDYMDL